MITEVKKNYCGYEVYTDDGYSYKIDTSYLSDRQLYVTVSMMPEGDDASPWSTTLHMSQLYEMASDEVVAWGETVVENRMIPQDVRDCIERILKSLFLF